MLGLSSLSLSSASRRALCSLSRARASMRSPRRTPNRFVAMKLTMCAVIALPRRPSTASPLSMPPRRRRQPRRPRPSPPSSPAANKEAAAACAPPLFLSQVHAATRVPSRPCAVAPSQRRGWDGSSCLLWPRLVAAAALGVHGVGRHPDLGALRTGLSRAGGALSVYTCGSMSICLVSDRDAVVCLLLSRVGVGAAADTRASGAATAGSVARYTVPVWAPDRAPNSLGP